MNENKQVRYYLPSYIAEYIQDKAFKRHISQVDPISEAIWLFQAQRQKEGGKNG